ncbi:MAG: nucleotidyl transferase AbiEii/AbiGii toxin family protein [Deltaproteobacteria bacterium]|nr:nucleotidyl transferase AbiEii/AbiGii toxin family protein [Deltaproteobacteria bacterium]
MIGGIAAIVHGVPRMTLDIDLLIRATPDNARALLAALLDAGLATAAQLDADELLAHEITVFRDRLRVDVQTASPGIRFEEVRPRALLLNVDGVEVPILSAEDLLAAKAACNRPKDQQDLEVLRGLLGRQR